MQGEATPHHRSDCRRDSHRAAGQCIASDIELAWQLGGAPMWTDNERQIVAIRLASSDAIH
jgi:hypothetical protein